MSPKFETRRFPKSLQAELDRQLPTGVPNRREGRVNDVCHKFLAMFVNKARFNTAREFTFSQKVLDKTVIDGFQCGRVRKKLVKFLNQSSHISVHSVPLPYGKNPNTQIFQKVYTVLSLRLVPKRNRRPPYSAGPITLSSIPISQDLDIGLGLGDFNHDIRISQNSNGIKADFHPRCGKRRIDREWEWHTDAAMTEAARQLGHNVDWSKAIYEGWAKLRILVPDYSEVRSLADNEEQAEGWISRWNRMRSPSYFKRKIGRVYHSLLEQKRELRQRYLEFEHLGCCEPTAEVDLSASYWTLLVSAMSLSLERNRLIRLLQDGRFYRHLCSHCVDYRYSDYQQLKIDVQKQCLFASKGNPPLRAALAELFPQLSKMIGILRQQGPPSLSRYLNRREGSFMLDSVLPEINRRGIPSIPLHDAIMVPDSEAEVAKTICESLGEQQFGFRPRWKITRRPKDSGPVNNAKAGD